MVSFSEIIIALVVIVPLAVVTYYKWRYAYWKKKNVPYIEPSIPWGTSENVFSTSKSIFVALKESYDELKLKGHRYGGLYFMTQPVFVPVDPDMVKRVLSKDFPHFLGHGLQVADEKKDPISGNLISLSGDKWRNMRVKLTPTFTSGKMKMMYPILLDCGQPMIDHINDLSNRKQPLHIKEILSCFTTDVIGSCAFGIECNSFKDPDAEFRKFGRKIFETNWKLNVMILLSIIIPKVRPGLSEDIRQFFFTSFKNIINYRENSKQKRNDFVQLLLDINQKALDSGSDDILTVEQMTAQSILFFLAGFETSSTTMNFCFHELAHNLDIQQKLREEIIATMENHDGELTYDCIMEMKYLNMVLEETLRKYPPAALMNRVCNKEYKIENDIVLDTGTLVFISVLGLHRDPEYFPDPDKFDPERFSDENKKNIPPFAYIPFGEGPRICIGLRFGLMQAKVGLCLLLKNYILTPHESMRYNMDFHKSSRVLSFKDNVLLNAEKINSF